jgi:Uma2 family endonuclease
LSAIGSTILLVFERWIVATVECTGAEQRFRLYGVLWQIYLELRDAPENDHVHMTYDGGELEMMSPSKLHEQYACLISRLIDAWTEELNIDIQSCRTVTFQREDLQRGLEPDNCYYVANESVVRSKTELDFAVGPPPDLAVEIDLGGGAMDQLKTYAAFGVPEVWRFDGRALRVFVLGDDGQYQQRPSSLSFPKLPPAEIEGVLARLETASETALVRSFRQWIRTVAL